MKYNYYRRDELQTLQERQVFIPSLDHVAIERSVPLENIGDHVTLYPFCRISGERTVIYPHAQVGVGGPVTIENSVIGSHSVLGELGTCVIRNAWVGPHSVLGSGMMEDSVILGKESGTNAFSTGFGFRLRKGSLYEEDASSAQHTDTKMTILFPWVTLGSNINLCDLLLSGGTGPQAGEFTEVGSGTVHFNFTLRGDKATGSLLGNVSQGVFLQEERLFLGGNGSLIGPASGEFGSLSAAGVRISGELKAGLNLGQGAPKGHMSYSTDSFSNARQIVLSQTHYICELIALFHWYQQVRMPLVQADPERRVFFQAGQQMVRLNIAERISQLELFLEKVRRSFHEPKHDLSPIMLEQQQNLLNAWPETRKRLEDYEAFQLPIPTSLEQALSQQSGQDAFQYTKIIQQLPEAALKEGVAWMQQISHYFE